MSLKNDYKDVTDVKLFELFQKGNRVAFTQIYHRYCKMLYGLSLKYLKDEDMAQDAVQQVFIKFWELHEHIVVTTSLRNYLYTMTRNYILNQIRSANKIVISNYEDAQEVAYDDVFDSDMYEKERILQVFYQAIEKLPERKREVCLLKLENDMTNEQIANALDISVSSVKSYYSESKQLLKRYLKKILNFIVFTVLFIK